MAIIGDRTDRKLKVDTKGMSGTKTFIVDSWQNDIENYNPALPKIGDPWSLQYPALRCINIEARALGGGLAELVADYSTDGLTVEDMWEESLDFSLETTDFTESWVWETTNRPVETQIQTPMPVMRYTLRGKVPSPPTQVIQQALNKINSTTFRGFEPGKLRLDGVSTNTQYDQSGNVVSVRTTYSFTWNYIGHQYVWRAALPERDEYGNIVYWQNTDPQRPGYTTDPNKVGSVKYVSGLAGIPGWDRPRYNDSGNWKYRYEAIDFSQVLGVPG